MSIISIKYHTCLAGYFSGGSLYLDESSLKKPDTRRLVEQPYQLTKGEKWDELEKTLTSLHFIEAKCKTGMVFEPKGLVHDSAQELPDNATTHLLLHHWTSAAYSNPKSALLPTLERHNNSVESVCVTPDGRRAVSGSDDKTLRIWDLESGKCINTLEGHNESVCGVNVTPDGKCAVSKSWDNTLKVWNLENILDKFDMFASRILTGKNPCPELQSEAWVDPFMISECPHCQEPLQYNPFIIDSCSKN